MNQQLKPFIENKRTPIPSLNIECIEYTHQITQAKHFHFEADQSENVFMVALRTIPNDSTGVAHILEHTTLCGSERFPVRDPFFMMIRRSLNTFMNAFTSSDWTAYPFATKNRKDFENLLSVYLDAVFFPRLDPLDFAQEGCRIEFSDNENQDSELVYKGVVFNEMKGAMSSITSQLWQALGSYVFPNSTYGYNSGGNPENIPDLTYEQLKVFYRKHYHPSNAIFMTFGDIPAIEHQQYFQSHALKRFTLGDTSIKVNAQPRFDKPVRASAFYATPQNEESAGKTHIVMAWLLNEISDPYELMCCHLLSSILLENSAAPLLQLLETSDYANGPSPLCGLDDSSKEMLFICGVEGAEPDAIELFESCVIKTLKKITEEGIPQARLQALLEQLELQQREISGDSYPYGLQIILSALPFAIHRHNPADALNIDPVLIQLKHDIKNPEFVRNLIHDKLLNNTHRVTLSLEPDKSLNAKNIQAEEARLAEIKSSLSTSDRQDVIKITQALEERQNQLDDPEILPSISLSDVPKDIEKPTFKESTTGNILRRYYPAGTNGLVYLQTYTKLPALTQEETTLLPLHNRLITELGLGSSDYLSTQDRQTAVCGGIHGFSSFKGAPDNVFNLTGYVGLSCKGLANKTADIQKLMQDTLNTVRFDEVARIRDIVSQTRARAERSVTGNGHSLAMQIAAQGYSPAAAIAHQSTGIAGIRNLKDIDNLLKQDDALNNHIEKLIELHSKLSSPSHILLVGEAQHEQLLNTAGDNWKNNVIENRLISDQKQTTHMTRQLWLTNSQVNFCAMAYPTIPPTHADAAPLTVLAGVLRNGFLHTAIREKGGAYGGGASHDNANGIFRFYSYRDPRLGETLSDFEQSIRWILDTNFEQRLITEAILGVIGSLDKPASPAGTAKEHFRHALFSYSDEMRMLFRQQVLSVSKADLLRVTEQYLTRSDASIGIVSHADEELRYSPLCEEKEIMLLTL